MILGDGHINDNSGHALEISHSGEQLAYLEYKRDILHSLLGGKKPKIHKRKDKHEYKISKGHRYFKILRKWLYRDRRKVITRKILNYLSPEAIAIWYMDDGSLAADKRNGKITAYKLVIYTFTNEKETQDIIDYFKEVWGISFYRIRKKLKSGYAYYIQCRTKEARKFIKLVDDYIIDSMKYKTSIRHEQQAPKGEDIV